MSRIPETSRALPIIFAVVLLTFPGLTSAPAADPDEFFEMRVRPVLAIHCLACHTTARLGGLDMRSQESLLQGGDSGPAIVPGRPEQSLLIQAIQHTHERLKMPLGREKLKEEEIQDLIAWVRMGAIWPAAELDSEHKTRESIIIRDQRAFWAFQPVRKSPLPKVKDTTWPEAPIDFFILSGLAARGLKPGKAADKRTMIRRAYFDLIGLPPTPEDTDAFVKDDSPDALARVVDRLLASPQYGERWGRYWLDVARYADGKLNSTKMEPYPNAYRYRDWVIRAFNDDMPYDRFVKAQIAGDQLEGNEKNSVAGLGFYGLSPQFQDDRIDATTRGFLALTVACARCHDHKFDPIPTEDYYAFLGVFNSSKNDEYPLAPKDVVEAYQQQKKKVEAAEDTLEEYIETQSRYLADFLASRTASYIVAAWQVLGPSQRDLSEVAGQEGLDGKTLERWVKYLGNFPRESPLLDGWDALLRQGAGREEIGNFAREIQELVVSLLREKKEIDQENKRRVAGMGIEEQLNEIELLSLERDSHFLWRDLASSSFVRRPITIPAVFDSGILYYGEGEIDRFLGGVWKEHLKGLRSGVKTLEDRLPPKYPFLHVISDVKEPKNEHVHIRGSKDNLGEEVPRRFLSILSDGEPKPFTQGSGRLELAEAVADRKNPLTVRVIVNRVWLHHFGQGIMRTPSNFGQMGDRPSHPELLDYLAVRLIENNWSLKALHREIMLSATYALSTDYSAKNHEIDPENRRLWRQNRRRLDAEALRDSLLYVAGNLDLTAGGKPTPLTDKENRRRTVYGTISRRKLDKLLGLFDFPNPNSTSAQRITTNTALQGLFFLNSELVLQQAEAFASRLEREAGTAPEGRIQKAYRLLFGRYPTAREIEKGLRFLNNGRNNWVRYTQVLLSSNEFIYVN